MTLFPRPRYTVMADWGVGEFLWVAYRTEDGQIGGNLLSLMDHPEDQTLISEGLFQKFADWAREYMAGKPLDMNAPWDVEWDSFNHRGTELTAMLKQELGLAADVQYLPPWNAPDASDRPQSHGEA